jgi:hypothetical protein
MTTSPAHAAVTILHEAGHATMHADLTDYHQHRGIYETEAESVAYVTAECSDSTPAPTASATSPDGPAAMSRPSRPRHSSSGHRSARSSTGSPSRTTKGKPRRLPPQRVTSAPAQKH